MGHCEVDIEFPFVFTITGTESLKQLNLLAVTKNL